jgi:hypothetical protein
MLAERVVVDEGGGEHQYVWFLAQLSPSGVKIVTQTSDYIILFAALLYLTRKACQSPYPAARRAAYNLLDDIPYCTRVITYRTVLWHTVPYEHL